jgi:6-phosphogluconolactonase
MYATRRLRGGLAHAYYGGVQVVRFGRRAALALIGAIAAAGPLSRALAQSAAQPLALQASQAGNLAGHPSGSFAHFQIDPPAAREVTLTLTYSPFEGGWGKAVGVNVWQGGNQLAGVTTDGASSGRLAATFTPSASAGKVIVQLFNYSPRTIVYALEASGLATPAAGAAGPVAGERYVYVGTYTKPNRAPGGLVPSEALGVYVFRMNPTTGGLTPVQLVTETPNPSFLSIDPSMNYVYATNEVSTWKGQPDGGVTAYKIDRATGRLSFLNDQPSSGAIPASSIVTASGKHLLVSNYVGASFTVLPIGADGKLGAATDVQKITGKSSNRARQEAPHPHDIRPDPTGTWVLGPDLGTDKVHVWKWDGAAGKLVPNAELPFAQVASGAGPRHFSFHPSGKYAYVINELDSSITVFAVDGERGTLQSRQTVPTLPSDFTGNSSCAEIAVHPTGRWVYGSNRGHDSLVIYAINQDTGKLSLVGWESTGGMVPRNFAIDPSGQLLLAANQNSDTIVPFRIDQASGKLTQTGAITNTPTPVCVLFGPTVA